jgi:type IX secretion system PorP/SprF family membrane protein
MKRNNSYQFVLNKSGGRCLALLLLVFCLPLVSIAQADIHFSQFYETSILRNPALTGVFSSDYKVGVYYRNQWSSISHPYETKLVTGEGRFQLSEMSNDFFSFGVLGFTDKAGSVDQRITGIYPAVNYNKSMNVDRNSYLSVGFTGGHIQYSFDPAKATFNNQFQGGRFDPSLPSLENIPISQFSFWDLGAGINYNTNLGENATIIVGASGYHFTQPKFSYYQVDGLTQNMRINVNAASGFNINNEILAQLQGNFAMQGTYKEVMAGGLVSWTREQAERKSVTLTGGLFYRVADAIIPVVRIKYNSLAIGASYDVNVSTLKDASKMNGGFEITLFHTGDFSDKGMAKKMVCPKF